MKRPLDPKFAERLKNLMLKEGYSIEGRDVSKFARNIGVKITTLHRWLRGTRPSIYEDLALLSDRLSVSVEYLMFGEVKSESKPILNKPMKSEGYLNLKELIDQELVVKIKIEAVLPTQKTHRQVSPTKKQ